MDSAARVTASPIRNVPEWRRMAEYPVPQDVLDLAVERLRREEPTLQAVLLGGSFARGEGDEYSDIDLLGRTAGEPRVEYRTWFYPTSAGRVVQLSIEMEPLALPTPEEPAPWALGFPVLEPQRYVWSTPAAVAVLGPDPSLHFPGGPPELGDFVELHMKARRAVERQDHRQLRWAARLLAEYAPPLLRPFNDDVVVSTPLEAYTAALSLANAPEHYREDFETCAGLAPATDAEIAAAAARLAREMVAYLRECAPETGHEPDSLDGALRNGALQRYMGF
jgi:predicted nucleotidyltransferase